LPDIHGSQHPLNQAFRFGTAAFNIPIRRKDLLPGRPGRLIQQGFRGEDLGGIAVAAGFYLGLGKTRHNVVVFIGLDKSFNGDNFPVPDPERRYET
jgi:hypothetical protein